MTVTAAFVVGPPEHGVVRHARQLAAGAGWPVVDRIEHVAPGSWVVLDATDRLWGTALTLVLIILVLNLLARLVSRRSKLST